MLAAALTVAVISCSAEADPQTAPTSLSTPTSAPTSTPTAEATDDPNAPVEPVLPAGAEADSRAGAEAFVRYYIELLNYAGLTGDVAELRQQAADCLSCDSLVDTFRQTYADGGRYETNGWQIESQFTVRDAEADWASLLEVRQSETTWIAEAGAEPKRYEPKQLHMRFLIKRLDRGWAIVRFTQT